MPLYWGKYLQAFVTQPTNYIYQFPDDMNALVDMDARRRLGDNRLNRKKFYEEGFGYFRDLQKVRLSALQLPSAYQANLVIDPQLVTLANTQESLFQKEYDVKYPQLDELIASVEPLENTILQDYYELLASGSLLIFSSTANVVNRFGGIIVEYQGKKYTPFQDLDDPHMQAVYRSIFERAGFVNIQFYKDPYFAEQVILLVAKKP